MPTFLTGHILEVCRRVTEPIHHFYWDKFGVIILVRPYAFCYVITFLKETHQTFCFPYIRARRNNLTLQSQEETS
jgi:hypothetical protein